MAWLQFLGANYLDQWSDEVLLASDSITSQQLTTKTHHRWIATERRWCNPGRCNVVNVGHSDVEITNVNITIIKNKACVLKIKRPVIFGPQISFNWSVLIIVFCVESPPHVTIQKLSGLNEDSSNIPVAEAINRGLRVPGSHPYRLF